MPTIQEISNDLVCRRSIYGSVEGYCKQFYEAIRLNNQELLPDFSVPRSTKGRVGQKNIEQALLEINLAIKAYIAFDDAQKKVHGADLTALVDMINKVRKESAAFFEAINAVYDFDVNEDPLYRLSKTMDSNAQKIRDLEKNYENACKYADEYRGTLNRVADFFYDIAEGFASLIHHIKMFTQTIKTECPERSLRYSTPGLIDRFFSKRKKELSFHQRQENLTENPVAKSFHTILGDAMTSITVGETTQPILSSSNNSIDARKKVKANKGMRVPFGKVEPDVDKKGLLLKLGFNLDDMQKEGLYYYLNTPDSPRFRCERHTPDFDKVRYSIYYNDVCVISINQKTASYDAYVYFNISASDVEAALAKNAEVTEEEVIEKLAEPVLTAYQNSLADRLAQLVFIVFEGGAARGYGRDIGVQLKCLRDLKQTNPAEHDVLIASSERYQELQSMFPRWTDTNYLQTKYERMDVGAFAVMSANRW